MSPVRTTRLAWLFAASVLAWLLVLVAAPSERSLGGLVRWVYAHASLTQVSLFFFLVAAVLAVVYLTAHERLYIWMEVVGLVALGLWLLGFLLSMIPARLSWGVWVDWNEPRTQLTLLVLALGVAILLLARWVDSHRFSAIAQIIFSAVVLILNRNTGVIRHPLDPIGEASAASIPQSYGLIFLIALFGSSLLVMLLVTIRQKRDRLAAQTTQHKQTLEESPLP